ncbi:hypothetical protein BH23VER1_BH23VER1_30660 [soil metagenome]
MKYFVKRRVRSLLILAAIIGVAFLLVAILEVALRSTAVLTGVVLLVVMLVLTFFNARKKLPFLPLLRASTWLQIHIYVGLFSVVLFLLHIGFRLPQGRLEIVLSVLFAVVAVSGVLGLLISRWLPNRMARSGEAVIYERIPSHQQGLTEEAERIVREAEVSTGASAISDFYFAELAPYFRGSGGVALIFGSEYRQQHQMQERLDAFGRYLDDKEKEVVAKLRDCIERKRNLDFQRAAQKLLKLWLFVHIPFTYSLLIVAFVHAWIALAYAGSL